MVWVWQVWLPMWLAYLYHDHYLVLEHVMGPAGVADTGVVDSASEPSLSLSWTQFLHLPRHGSWVQQVWRWQTPWPTSPRPEPCPAGHRSWCCSASGSASPVGWSAELGTCCTPPAFLPPQSACRKILFIKDSSDPCANRELRRSKKKKKKNPSIPTSEDLWPILKN